MVGIKAKHFGVAATIALSLGAGVGITGCSIERSTITPLETQSDSGASTGESAPSGVIPGFAGADADRVETTDELVAVSEIGFLGVVESFSQGVMAVDGQSFDFRPVVARVTSVDVFHGAVPTGDEGTVYLALPGTATPDDYARSIPVGTRLIAYANSLPIGSDLTLKSGVPDGAPLFNIVHPAGFALETEQSGRTIATFPLDGAAVIEMSLEQLLPGNDAPRLEQTYEELYPTPAP
ncbi:hypothetical protein [uncultured Microbacterium sp.]|uniref:hypothetical protein n=1 Tax=uncultured Microbacterium sp. TaxID=191216 RepID=UPI0028D69917|nr:hypothetical protein [uncultured Microbacterium sp.]